MNTIKQKPCFIINSIGGRANSSNIRKFEEMLNQYLHLKDYGTSLEQLHFTYLYPSNEAPIKLVEEKKTYIAMAKLLKMSLKLPTKSLEGTDSGIDKEIMASIFLNSIALYADLDIPDFDWQIFYIDVKTLLVKEQWLQPSFSMEKQFILDFGIGGEDWLLMGKKLSNFYHIERMLNKHLQLSDYGVGIHQLKCAFIVLPETAIIQTPILKEYLIAKKQVNIVVVLNYQELLTADAYSLFQLLSEHLLKIVLQVAEFQILDFDWKRLYRHMRWTLITENWLDNPLTLQEKASITGLPNSLIKRIESNIDSVRVGAVKTYCEKLKIPYQEVVPELFPIAE